MTEMVPAAMPVALAAAHGVGVPRAKLCLPLIHPALAPHDGGMVRVLSAEDNTRKEALRQRTPRNYRHALFGGKQTDLLRLSYSPRSTLSCRLLYLVIGTT